MDSQYAHCVKLEDDGDAQDAAFVYLDEESIDVLAQAPAQEELASMSPDGRSETAWQFWVKLVDTARDVMEDGDDIDETMSSQLGRRRVRMYYFFDVFMRLCEEALHEMSIEGQWRQRVVGLGDRKWEFCKVPDWNGKRERGLSCMER